MKISFLIICAIFFAIMSLSTLYHSVTLYINGDVFYGTVAGCERRVNEDKSVSHANDIYICEIYSPNGVGSLSFFSRIRPKQGQEVEVFGVCSSDMTCELSKSSKASSIFYTPLAALLLSLFFVFLHFFIPKKYLIEKMITDSKIYAALQKPVSKK